jgi:hypothetical protein
MNRFSRRRLFGALSAFSLLALARCAATGTGATPAALTPAQIAADAQGIIAVMQADFPVIVALDPSLTTPANAAKIQADLTTTATDAATVSATVSALTGATTLQTVENDINEGLNVLSPVVTAAVGTPLAPYALVVQAIIALLPSVETFVNTTLGLAGATAALRARAVAPGMNADAARKVLGIKVV